MLLNLASIINTPGGVVPFHFIADFSDMDFGSCCPAQEPVDITGKVVNEAGVLLLTAKVTTVMHCVCDRCASEFVRDYALDYSTVLVTEIANEENEDDQTFLLQSDNADLDEIMRTAFVLNQDSKMLCTPDCKGLCPTCGANLNDGPCGCKAEPDPRLAVLAQLLKDKE